MPGMAKRITHVPIALAVAALVVLALYIGSYLVLLDSRWRYRDKGLYIAWEDGTPVDTRTGPDHIEGAAIRRFYWPLELVDQRLRPHIWDEVLIEE